ncbi:MAG: NADH-quinone oxidoreductase subunit L [Nitrospira sp.]|nr:NADH-quinone oxidoreductase subunit L [Nitrospira sp.]
MDALPALIAILIPLLGSLFIALAGSGMGERVARIGVGALTVSTVAALLSLYQTVRFDPILLTAPDLPLLLAPTLLVDRLASVMMVLITAVSLVVHVYSLRYMQGDGGYVRFFALLGLLTSVLLALVTSGHLLWLFAAWHAVTWLLVALIGFNKDSDAARKAGRTTLYVQSAGDLALLAGIVMIFITFGTFDLTKIIQTLATSPTPRLGSGAGWSIKATDVVTGLLVLSVMTKSAQFPFHVWLPGTIEAPTPVSAMLHAGIVNAGGFLVNRLAPIFGSAPTTLYLLFMIGAMTALIGASTMLTQSSVKRALVYSTMGQMGYMVMECGLGAFALGIFHLCAHGLFKATLFLNSGANIHKARVEFKLPPQRAAGNAPAFSLTPWATGLFVTLILPLIIVLMAFELVHIPLFEAQGTMIFLFFAWVTSSQAVFSLYRMNTAASWKVSVTMIATLTAVSFTYLWAGEAFSHFLYPEPGQVAAYFQAAAWNPKLFGAFIATASLFIVAVWAILYGKSHGYTLALPPWWHRLHTRLYVAFLNALFLEDLVRAVGSWRRTRFPKRQGTPS